MTVIYILKIKKLDLRSPVLALQMLILLSFPKLWKESERVTRESVEES